MQRGKTKTGFELPLFRQYSESINPCTMMGSGPQTMSREGPTNRSPYTVLGAFVKRSLRRSVTRPRPIRSTMRRRNRHLSSLFRTGHMGSTPERAMSIGPNGARNRECRVLRKGIVKNAAIHYG